MAQKWTSLQTVAEEGNDSLECVRVALHIWNPVTTQWEAYSGLDVKADNLTVTMGDVEKGVTGAYWRKTLYDYDADDNLIYKGYHTTYNVADSDTNHFIVKYTYTSGNVTKKQMTTGAWTNRTGLSW